jgi:ribonuclease HI
MSVGHSATWLGYQIRKVNTGIQVEIAEASWDKLEEHLHLAHEEPIPPLSANETILGWISQQGAAYERDLVRDTYTGILRQASVMGFDEIPSQEEVATRWYRAYLCDWVERREWLSLSRGSVSALADGCADQHCDLATSSRRGGVDGLSDCSPQLPRPRREVSLYCDGSCLSPSRVGGWAYLVVEPETGWQDAVAGGVRRATNNRMELTAVIRGLASLPDPAEVRLVVDSEYVHMGITRWLPGWKQHGWRAGGRPFRPLKNVDLWQQLDAQLQRHVVMCQWVRGHCGHAENEFVDRLADEAARSTLNTEGGDLAEAM